MRLQVFNVFLALAAAAGCLCACVFAGLHVSQLYGMSCDANATVWSEEASRSWNSTCVCRDRHQFYTYDPLSCDEVLHLLPVYLIASSSANGVAVVACFWYILLLWSSRFAYTYAGLKVAEQKNAVMASLY